MFFVITPLHDTFGPHSHRTYLSLTFLGLSFMIGVKITQSYFTFMLYSMEHYLHFHHLGYLVGPKLFDLYREAYTTSHFKTKCYVACHRVLLPQLYFGVAPIPIITHFNQVVSSPSTLCYYQHRWKLEREFKNVRCGWRGTFDHWRMAVGFLLVPGIYQQYHGRTLGY